MFIVFVSHFYFTLILHSTKRLVIVLNLFPIYSVVQNLSPVHYFEAYLVFTFRLRLEIMKLGKLFGTQQIEVLYYI